MMIVTKNRRGMITVRDKRAESMKEERVRLKYTDRIGCVARVAILMLKWEE